MKKMVVGFLSVAVALLSVKVFSTPALAVDAQNQFSSPAAEQSFKECGSIADIPSLNVRATNIDTDKNIEWGRSSGCSVGCSSGCSSGCSVGCSSGCSVGCRRW